jgi:hypothetical protein
MKLASALLLASVIVGFQTKQHPTPDLNRESVEFTSDSDPNPGYPHFQGSLGSVIIPGDPDSTRVLLSLRNEHFAPVTEVVVQPFAADEQRGLVIQWAALSFDGTGPIIKYPGIGVSGRGPLVVSFADFDPGETFQTLMDPDSHSDGNYGVSIEGMAGTIVMVAYLDGARAITVLKSTPEGSFGVLTRIDPYD